MIAKKGKRAGKKIKDLAIKSKGKNVKGGGFNGFVNFGDIKGESSDKGHKDWIEVMSYNLKV